MKLLVDKQTGRNWLVVGRIWCRENPDSDRMSPHYTSKCPKHPPFHPSPFDLCVGRRLPWVLKNSLPHSCLLSQPPLGLLESLPCPLACQGHPFLEKILMEVSRAIFLSLGGISNHKIFFCPRSGANRQC